ncbi:MAG: DUF1887 family protein [Lachnospiraceae bacterium]|nr:DUF1887 family protein [Lachnospiraceae bacterium]
MNINIEFFDEEPMENLITCMNFKMDKVIFFGHSDIMTPERIKATQKSLRNICGITNAEFFEVSQKNLYKIVELMEREIKKEVHAGGKCFFDLTGGEDLVLVAMGILSTQHKVPMHKFDLRSEELYLLNKWDDVPRIDEVVTVRDLQLTLDDVIGLYGGVINYRQQKEVKSHLTDMEFEQDVKRMWEVARQNPRKWNALSSVLKSCIKYEGTDLSVSMQADALVKIAKRTPDMTSIKEIRKYLHQLAEAGILDGLRADTQFVGFMYKSELIRDCLLDAGCLLELHTYYERKQTGKYSDCRVGVHIDWDGIIHGYEVDVENEIDVMLLEGKNPVFISCKNGKVNQMALYELDAVASRFGGKYVKKELAATQEISQGYRKRAEEMGILIRMEN